MNIKNLLRNNIFWFCLIIFVIAINVFTIAVKYELTWLIEYTFNQLLKVPGLYLFYSGTLIFAWQYLRDKEWLKAILIFIFGLIWIFSFESTIGYFRNLGTDSFLEAQNFDIIEAIFWLKTFWLQFNFSLTTEEFFLYTSVAITIFIFVETILFFFRTDLKKNKKIKFYFAKILIICSIIFSIWGTIDLFITKKHLFAQIQNNFTNPSPDVKSNPKLSVLLYIGESTSTMNMSFYGYPRKTTPLLDLLKINEKGLIKFDNVFSTHTHTSPSLLEALSLSLKAEDYLVPITQRRRVPIVNVLNKANIKTELYSNQGQAGTWNQTSTVIFKNAEKKIFSTNNRLLGNNDHKIEKPFDHEFFNKSFTKNSFNSSLEHSFYVFHGYAGHGEYRDNIPSNYRNNVDNFFEFIEPSAVTGQDNSINLIEEYDSAIKYIDYSVTNAIKFIKYNKKPLVFVYFSDHGESVFTKRGHDSSRFVHEMVRVPFLIFFNDAARQIAPDLYKKYYLLSKNKNISSLAQLPSTLFDLFGVKVIGNTMPVIGELVNPKPILIRQTKDGITGVNLSTNELDYELIDKTDSATNHLISNQILNEINDPVICYHRSNTIAKLLRGAMVTKCLEIDIVVNDDEIFVYHPPSKNTGLKLKNVFFSIHNSNINSVWVDGKNLNSSRSCNKFISYLKNNKFYKSKILLEFPSYSHSAKSDIKECVEELKKLNNIYRSYYVPTKDILECSKALKKNLSFNESPYCKSLKLDLIEAKNSKLFSDISFDYRGIEAIRNLNFIQEFRWNTWNLELSQLKEIKKYNFRMLILNNDDPNNL